MQDGMIPLSLRKIPTSVSRSSGPETKKPPDQNLLSLQSSQDPVFRLFRSL